MQLKDILQKGENISIMLGQNNEGWPCIIAWDPAATFSGDNVAEFKKWTTQHQDKKLIGYLSYDLAYQLHNITQTAEDDLKLPKIFFHAYEKWQAIEQNQFLALTQTISAPNFQARITQEQYHAAYQKIKDYITAGDIYQINLTHRLEAITDVAPRDLFLKIAETNPVNHLCYLEGPDFEVLSASPERFIKIANRQIETKPIKGTRPRHQDPQKDQDLAQELLNSSKEAAELNMITDLLRNDTGKVSQIGSVKIAESRALQQCPTVWHTYSRITGEIAPEISELDALISMLPGGSITGCPKKRAIEIIDELEPKTRGIYTGCIGYIAPGQKEIDMNIAIRTIIKKDTNLYLSVGGGIVLDSKEDDEYDETIQKAKSFTNLS